MRRPTGANIYTLETMIVSKASLMKRPSKVFLVEVDC